MRNDLTQFELDQLEDAGLFFYDTSEPFIAQSCRLCRTTGIDLVALNEWLQKKRTTLEILLGIEADVVTKAVELEQHMIRWIGGEKEFALFCSGCSVIFAKCDRCGREGLKNEDEFENGWEESEVRKVGDKYICKSCF